MTAAPTSPTADTDEIRDLLDAYDVERAARTDRPWVLSNFVASIDGRTAVHGRVGTLSSPTDQRLFHHLRGLADAILVGASTVRAEHYGRPTVPAEVQAARKQRGQLAHPRLCIVSRSLELDGAQDLLQRAEPRPIVITCDTAPAARVVDLAPHVDLISAGTDRVEFPRALAVLRRHGIRTVLCEGGPTVNGELFRHQLVDEVCLTIAPFIGGDPLGLFEGTDAPLHDVRIVHARCVEGSVFLRALVNGARA
jgi:riboflavin-specific deaminase-like protein